MPRGSKPGERRGGRQKGTPNKVNAELKALAAAYTKEALETIVIAMRSAPEPMQRAAAAEKILDRGHGKPNTISETKIEGQLTIQYVSNIPEPDA